MKKSSISILLIFFCLISNYAFTAPKIILKLDDLRATNESDKSARTLDFLVQRNVKAGFGVIANSLESNTFKNLLPYIKATNASGESLFEIWNHGYDHACPEFSNRTYDYQETHFEQADQLIFKLLGIQMHSFGTPCNKSDTLTNGIISQNPNYKVFLFSSVKPANTTDVLYLNNRVNIEISAGVPDSAYFVTNYLKSLDKYSDYMVLQAHPPMFTPAAFVEFKKCIDYLIKQDCEFVTPYEYYTLVTNVPATL
jgi:peptidoglycan/xylan/chitin deacetylase (PgdA/CDA1 family)